MPFHFCVFDEYQSVLIPRKFLSAQTNSWLRVCTLMSYLWIALEKNQFIDSLVEHLKKNHEKANFPDFQFRNLKFSQERYFGPFMLLQPLTVVAL